MPRPILAAIALLCGLAFPTAAQTATVLSGRNGQPGTAFAPITVSKPIEPQVRRAEPVVRRAEPVAAAAPTSSGSTGAVFRPGDAFELRMTGMPQEDAAMYSLTFTIGGDGYVNVPLGGQVRAAGLTQSQVEKAIERRLVEEKVFTHPTATINVPNQVRFVTVGGSVRAPNRLAWAPDLTLLSALSACGGPGDFGGDKINLIRNGAVEHYSFKKLNKNPADDPKLLPGDRIDLP